MPKVHDRGGWPTQEPIDRSEHPLMDWEFRLVGLYSVLGQKGLMRTDESRRAIEGLSLEEYESLSYHERRAAALEAHLLERGLFTAEELDRKMADLEGRWH